jgi:preprotein translocase subunit SecE
VQRYIEEMKKIKEYFIDTYNELVHKVTWPKWSELQSSAVVVMVASLIFAVVVFAMDFTFKEVLELVYGMFY